MAIFSGSSGKVTYATGDELNVRNWTVEETADVGTGAHSSSSGWTDADAGMITWTGSFAAYQDDTTKQPIAAGDSASCTFTDGDANTYAGTVIAQSVSYNVDVEGGGLVTVTVQFQGSGALTVTQA